MNVRENNKAKLEKLDGRVRWAAIALEEDAWNNGLAFEVMEVFRSQERQNQLYKQGRTTPGKIVTWTHHSLHTDSLAIDVRSYADGVPNFYQRLAKMAEKYGITAPLQCAPYYDMGHFEFNNVGTEPIKINPNGTMAKNVVRRAVARLEARGSTISLWMAKRLKARLKMA